MIKFTPKQEYFLSTVSIATKKQMKTERSGGYYREYKEVFLDTLKLAMKLESAVVIKSLAHTISKALGYPCVNYVNKKYATSCIVMFFYSDEGKDNLEYYKNLALSE